MASCLDFRASSVSGGKLTPEEYAARRDECTKEELERLMETKEFKEWEASKRGRSGPFLRRPLLKAALAALLFLTMLAGVTGGALLYRRTLDNRANRAAEVPEPVLEPLAEAVRDAIASHDLLAEDTKPSAREAAADVAPSRQTNGTKRKHVALLRALHQEIKSLRGAAALAARERNDTVAVLERELSAARGRAGELDTKAAALRLALEVASKEHGTERQATRAELEVCSRKLRECSKQDDTAIRECPVCEPADTCAARNDEAVCASCAVPAALAPLIDRWPVLKGTADEGVPVPLAAISLLITAVGCVAAGFALGRALKSTLPDPSSLHSSSADASSAADEALAMAERDAAASRSLAETLATQLAAQEEALIASQSALAAEEARAQRAASLAKSESSSLSGQVEELRRLLDSWRCAAGELSAELEAAASATFETGSPPPASGAATELCTPGRAPLTARAGNGPLATPVSAKPVGFGATTAATPGPTPGPTPATARFRSWLAASPAPAAPGPADEDPDPWLAAAAARVAQLRERVLGASRRAAEAGAEARSRRTDSDWHAARVRELATDLELAREQLQEERRARGAAEARVRRAADLERELLCLEAQLLLEAADGERERLEGALFASRAEAAELAAAGARLVHAERAIGAAHRELDAGQEEDGEGVEGAGGAGAEYVDEEAHGGVVDEAADEQVDEEVDEEITTGDHQAPRGAVLSLEHHLATPRTASTVSAARPPLSSARRSARGAAELEEDLRRAVEEKVRALEMLASAEKRMLETRALRRGRRAGRVRARAKLDGRRAHAAGRAAALDLDCPPTVAVAAYEPTPGSSRGRASTAASVRSRGRAASPVASTSSTLRSAGGFVGRMASRLLGGSGRARRAVAEAQSAGAAAAPEDVAVSQPAPLDPSPLPTPEALASWLERTQALFGDADEALGAEIRGLDFSAANEERVTEHELGKGDEQTGEPAVSQALPEHAAALGVVATINPTSSASDDASASTSAASDAGAPSPSASPIPSKTPGTPAATSATALCAALRETGQEVEALLERLRSLSCGAGEGPAHDLTRAYAAARAAAAELAEASRQASTEARGAPLEAPDADAARKAEADGEVDRASDEVCAAHRAFDRLMATKLADATGEDAGTGKRGDGTPLSGAGTPTSISAEAFDREAGRRTTAQRALNAALAAKRNALDTVSEAAKALEAAEAALEARAGARADAQQGLAAAATRRAAAAARLHAAQNDLAEAVGAALETLQAAEIYDAETSYFTAEYTNFGTVLKGFEGFLTSKNAAAKNKNKIFRLEDRAMSLSSTTSPAELIAEQEQARQDALGFGRNSAMGYPPPGYGKGRRG
ncbi:hypothetical protein QBZ16_001964 [Prototheca wickerhamii]|uniref:Uncharacterized protein n=1 Tax=Prototheca wickerhamii TaxID=3111 RepID=A0AAD9ILX8_PROWI|nr:hypothetical protein QBZ16_001964 [Prototheca wickerhamii]